MRPAPPPARSEQDTTEKFCFPFKKNLARAYLKPQTKLFCGEASVSERRRGGFLCSGIFDKVGSSAVIKILYQQDHSKLNSDKVTLSSICPSKRSRACFGEFRAPSLKLWKRKRHDEGYARAKALARGAPLDNDSWLK